MPTQSSGPISFADINSALGTGTPLSFNQLYRGGPFVPDITPNSDIPTSGEINMQEMYDTWGIKTKSFTVTVGTHNSGKKKGALFGFGTGFGSISNGTFLTYNGTMTITGLYYSTTDQAWFLTISSTSSPADNNSTFVNVSVSGYSIGGVRGSATNTQVVGNSREWEWSVLSTSHPTSGTIACTLHHYG